MATGGRLEAFLESHSGPGYPHAAAVAETILAIARAGCRIAELLAAGSLHPGLSAHRGESRGDTAKELDLQANALILDALRAAPVAAAASEELDTVLPMRLDGSLVVAIDPLDGSSNIDTTAPVGTIFSILPAEGSAGVPGGDIETAFLRPGTEQLAAGFLIYGSQTALMLTLGDGTHLFTFDRAGQAFRSVSDPRRIPLEADEYAINGSNQRHWSAPVRRYVAECQQGLDGPRHKDFNTRWLASLVAEIYRIMVRGGVYLYPADARPSCREGRLRLIYEANPVALLVEQAGGAATDGRRRILDIVPEWIHQRVGLVCGAIEEVALIGDYHVLPEVPRADPLFGSRTLFRPDYDHRGAHS